MENNHIECAICKEVVSIFDTMHWVSQEIMYPMFGDNEYVCDDCDPIEQNVVD